MGPIEFVPKACGFYSLSETEDGRTLRGLFHPDNMFLDRDPLPLYCEGDIVNDTDTPLVLREPRITFLHPGGSRIVHRNPKMQVEGSEVATVTVPAHGVSEISITIPIHRDDLAETYAETIPVLHLTSPAGRKFEFRLDSSSFYGRNIVVWPRKSSLPVFALKRLQSDFLHRSQRKLRSSDGESLD